MPTINIPRDDVSILTFELDDDIRLRDLTETLNLDSLKSGWGTDDFELEVDLGTDQIVEAVDQDRGALLELLECVVQHLGESDETAMEELLERLGYTVITEDEE